jgi:hypothetical protein
MVTCGSYMFEFSVSKDMIFFNKNDKRREINEQEGGALALNSQVQ